MKFYVEVRSGSVERGETQWTAPIHDDASGMMQVAEHTFVQPGEVVLVSYVEDDEPK